MQGTAARMLAQGSLHCLQESGGAISDGAPVRGCAWTRHGHAVAAGAAAEGAGAGCAAGR